MKIGLGNLSELEILRGSFSLVFVIISFVIGIKILSKYVVLRRKELITVGLTWIFISSPWWGSAFSFLTIILFSYAFDPVVYLFFITAFIAPGLFCWIYSFGILVYPKIKNRIIIPYFIICAIYEIVLLFFLFTNPDLIAVYEGNFSFRRTLFNIGFLVFVILTTVITGGIFAIKSMASENAIVRWKGIFFSIAIFSFVLASVLDVFSVGNLVLQIFTRIILITSGIEYYLGFFLPNRLAVALTGEKSPD